MDNIDGYIRAFEDLLTSRLSLIKSSMELSIQLFFLRYLLGSTDASNDVPPATHTP